MLKWIVRILSPVLLADIFFRRLPYAKDYTPPYDAKTSLKNVEHILKPGDAILCRGLTADSASVAAWSCSDFTHVAIIGPDKFVYDITPIENERKMTLREFVTQYEGKVYWRPIKTAYTNDAWKDIPPLTFRGHGLALLGATFSEIPFLKNLWNFIFTGFYDKEASYCSEYVCMAMGLDVPRVSHPKNFAKGGRYDYLYTNEIYYITS